MTLTWNNNTNCYEAEVEEGTLIVWGDAFAQARHDDIRTLTQERHPNASEEEIDTIIGGDEGDAIDTEVWNELIDPSSWLHIAEVVDPSSDEGATGDAWIVRKS